MVTWGNMVTWVMCGLWVTVTETSPHTPGSVQSYKTNLRQLEPSCVLQPDLKLHWVGASSMEKNREGRRG